MMAEKLGGKVQSQIDFKDDYLKMYKLESDFETWIATVFDLKDLQKYVESDNLFTFEYLQLSYFSAYYWREALLDKINDESKEERVMLIRSGNDAAYKDLLQKTSKVG